MNDYYRDGAMNGVTDYV